MKQPNETFGMLIYIGGMLIWAYLLIKIYGN